MFFNTVLFKVYGDETGKFLSLCKKNNVNIRNFNKNTKETFGLVSAKEYKKASNFAKKSGIRLKIIKKFGIGFKMRKYRRRNGFIIAGAVAVFLLVFLQNFVWTIEINGNENVSDFQILSAAHGNGLKTGTFLPTQNLEKIKLSMLKELPSLSFLSLNKMGSRIEIEVAEEVPKPQIIHKNIPCNIVALKTARIISSEIYAGQKMFKDGDTVFKGDLLVSGIVETADGKSTYHHSLAKIRGETKFEKEFSLPLKQTEKIYSDKTKTRYKIVIFGKKFPLFLKNSYSKKYDVIKTPLPFGIEKETLIFYDENTVNFSEKEALTLIEKNITDYEKENLKGSEIISREISARTENNTLFCKIDYRCIEDIVSYKELETDLDFTLPTNP